MRLNSKGQVTIPADVRRRQGLLPGEEVEVVEEGDTIRIVRPAAGGSRGTRLVSRLRGTATTARSTDELMALLRGE